jgi:hypothetical protein
MDTEAETGRVAAEDDEFAADDLAENTEDDPSSLPTESTDPSPDSLGGDLASGPVETSQTNDAEDPTSGVSEGSGTSELAPAPGPPDTEPQDLAPDTSAPSTSAAGTFISSPFDKPGPEGVATYSPDDLALAIATARASDEKLDDARVNPTPGLRAAAEEFYRSFANLAAKATYVSRDGAQDVLAASRELVSSFEFDDKKQRMIANATRNWIKNEVGSGVFGAANVIAIRPMGDLFELDLTLMGKQATPITVITRLDPGSNEMARFSEGDRILFLGTVIKDAQQRIEGYTGMDNTVIWMTDQVVTIP